MSGHRRNRANATAAGDVLDLRRRIHGRAPDPARTTTERRSPGKASVLVTFNYRLGAFRVFLASRANQGVGPERVRQPGAHGHHRRVAVGAKQYRRVRRRPRQCHDFRRIRRRRDGRRVGWISGRQGPFPACDCGERAVDGARHGAHDSAGAGRAGPTALSGPPASAASRTRPRRHYPPLAELRGRSTEEVAKTMRGSGMIIDGWIVPEDLSITFAQGKQNPVDVIVGSNKDEHLAMGGQGGVPRHADVVHAAVRRTADRDRETCLLVLLHARAAASSPVPAN